MRSKPLRTAFSVFIISCLLSLPASAFAAETRLEKAMPEGGKVVLTFAAAPLLTMTETPFTVELTGATGKTLTDAAVSLQLVMPAMSMPLNNPKAHWKEECVSRLGRLYHGWGMERDHDHPAPRT